MVRTGLRVAMAWLLGLSACLAQSPGQAPAGPAPQQRGGLGMMPGVPASLAIDLAARGAEFLVGAELTLIVTLRNTAAAGGSLVHSPDEHPPFTFHVQPEKGPAFDLSYERFVQETESEVPPPRAPEMVPLRGGASLDYQVNLTSIMPKPAGPGVYRVSVSYPHGATPRSQQAITVRLVPPRPLLLALAPNGTQRRLGAAYVHAGPDGQMLYQREGRENRPTSGVFAARKLVRQPGSLALSTDAEATAEQRWVGWTEAGKAAFLQVWDKAVLHTTETDSLPPGSVLVSPGWTLTDHSAHFLAAAPSEFTLISMPDRKKPRLRSFALEPGAIPAPDQLRAGFTKSQVGKQRIFAIWPVGGRLLHAIINPTGAATAPSALVERAEPVVALDIQGVARDGSPIIHALFAAPGAAQAHLVRVRAGEPLQEVVIPLPHGHERGVLRWQVSAGEPATVAVQIGNERIMAWTSATKAWRQLSAPPAASVDQLKLVRLQTVWASWVDAAQGLRFENLAP